MKSGTWSFVPPVSSHGHDSSHLLRHAWTSTPTRSLSPSTIASSGNCATLHLSNSSPPEFSQASADGCTTRQLPTPKHLTFTQLPSFGVGCWLGLLEPKATRST